uniref:MATH domain-containing protein n=1 Tax=Brassica campestris TaxID=3711 RepID=M4CIF6_BRACM
MGSNSSTAASTEVSTIVKHWREHPPSSYSLKIHNFSELEKSTALSDHKYQSRLFTYGGYNLRLIIYPKGNGEDNVRGFISMYVEIDSKSLMLFTSPTEIFAELRFFVYNKKENKYFTIQSQCEFGVDVIVAPSLTNWEVLSFTKKYFDPKFSWTIKDFSELKEDVQKSNSFPMGGKEWVLALYPKGALEAHGKWLSIFLCLADSDKPEADEKIFVQARLGVLNPLGSYHFEYPLETWYTEQSPGWGWAQFLPLAELPKVYLDKEDALKVEIEFKVVSETKYSFTEADPLEKDWVQLTPEN